MPEDARYVDTGQPRPPRPMIATFEFTINDCPSISISGRTICLLYLSNCLSS